MRFLCLLFVLAFFSGTTIGEEIVSHQQIVDVENSEKRQLCNGTLCTRTITPAVVAAPAVSTTTQHHTTRTTTTTAGHIFHNGYTAYPVTRAWAYAVYPIYVRTYAVRAVSYPVYSRCLFSERVGDELPNVERCKRVLKDVDDLQHDEMVVDEVKDIMENSHEDEKEADMMVMDEEEPEPMMDEDDDDDVAFDDDDAEKRNLWYPYYGYGAYYYPYYSYGMYNPYGWYGYRFLGQKHGVSDDMDDKHMVVNEEGEANMEGGDESIIGGSSNDDAQARRLHHGYRGYGGYGYGGYGRMYGGYGYGGYGRMYGGYGRMYGGYGGGCYSSYCRYLKQKGMNVPDYKAVEGVDDDDVDLFDDDKHVETLSKDDDDASSPMIDDHHKDVEEEVAPARRLHYHRGYGYGMRRYGYGYGMRRGYGYGGYGRMYGGYGYGMRRYGYGGGYGYGMRRFGYGCNRFY